MSVFFIFLIKRTLLLIPLAIAMAIMMFFITDLIPGYPKSSDALLLWLINLARGDLGISVYYGGRPVAGMIVDHIVPTLKLTGLSFLIVLIIGTFGGIICAFRQHSYADRVINVLSVSGMAVPDFWLGILLILLFSVSLNLVPVAGYETFGETGIMSLRYLIVPALALSLGQIAFLLRIVRARMLDVLSQDYITAARAMGLPQSTVLKYAFKNTLVSVFTLSGMILATLIGGSVIIENIFAIPGVGRLLVLSILRRDFMVAKAAIMLVAFTYLIINFLIDVLYALVDPRIGYETKKR